MRRAGFEGWTCVQVNPEIRRINGLMSTRESFNRVFLCLIRCANDDLNFKEHPDLSKDSQVFGSVGFHETCTVGIE
jgi:hypothetical protein